MKIVEFHLNQIVRGQRAITAADRKHQLPLTRSAVPEFVLSSF